MLSTSARNRGLAFGTAVVLAVAGGAAVGQGGDIAPIVVPRALLTVTAQTVLWLLIAADLLLFAGMVYALISDRSLPKGEPRKFSLLTYLVALVPTLLAGILLLVRPRAAGSFLFFRQPVGVSTSPLRAAAATGSASSTDWTWLSLLLAALIAAAFLSWLFWPARRLHRSPPARPMPRTSDEVVEAIDVSIDALSAIRDPRRAIIAAYAAMESSIVRAGIPHRRSDTPLEFLRRTSRAAVEIAGDAGRLTYLFEFAKFSQHNVDESMRSDALSSLRQIRDRLTAEATS